MRKSGWLLAVLLFAILFAFYVGSYTWLSRRGMRESREIGAHGFLYMQWEELHEPRDMAHHHQLARFYAPLNWIDQTFCGGDGPVRNVTFGLSAEP